ncbi:MAG: helicase-exonuclease AddAB subunit AddA [Acutalibacteraceae bacterium]|jgi:ATP-dependent helicase/nuclease subunit A
MKWTPDQLKAINATDGTLLVSAAAGSGKTAVLVERVIGRITASVNPCGIEELLTVTFTKAAAGEMRQRISEALTRCIEQNPRDERLRRQQLMLPFAQISTIDSFCNTLVRDNFHLLNINPDYRILDEGDLSILRADASEKVIEDLYGDGSEAALALIELLIQNNDDRLLSEYIIKIHNESQAYPDPSAWLDALALPFNTKDTAVKSVWGKVIIEYALKAVRFCLKQNEEALKELEQDENLKEKYEPAFISDKNLLLHLVGVLEKGSWDEAVGAVKNLEYDRLGSFRGESLLKERIKGTRDEYKNILGSLAKHFCAAEDEHREDLEYLSPIVEKLVETVRGFEREFSRLKKEANGADFSDVLHMALALLVTFKPDGSFERTPLARQMSKSYREILVDEYQDVNKAQDCLFEALSKDGQNLFLVGDVKQCIYRFRQAMPEIFTQRLGALPLYEDKNHPARVILGTNFRSRKGVTGFANLVFGQLMSKDVGEVDYGREEALVPGAVYPDSDLPETQLHIIETPEENAQERIIIQARYIAELIGNMIKEGLTVTDKKGTRPAEYRDFCVLMRSVQGKAPVFLEEFSKYNMPAYSELTTGFLETQEVAFILSLMRVLDNPLQDIPLLTVMLSPVFGFTPDELAELRLPQRKTALYSCVVRGAEEGNVKCNGFLKRLEEFRMLGATLSSGEFVRRLLEETGWLALSAANAGGEQRRANLHLLQDYANTYEAAGHMGLSGFIRFIDKLNKNKGDLSPAAELSEAADVVRIMSIHKSKGLEFPVCILADCSAGFNTGSLSGNIVLSSQTGIGLNRKDVSTFRQFSTLSRQAAIISAGSTDASEEMRVLYVAMTRARERLITVMAMKNPSKKLEKLALNIRSSQKIDPFPVMNSGSFSDWILMAALRHPDAGELRKNACADDDIILPADFELSVSWSDVGEYTEEAPDDKMTPPPNPGLLSEIEKRLSYIYPYSELTKVVAKRAASDVDTEDFNAEFFASKTPAFISETGLTPAQRGTAIHKFMQYADYLNAAADFEAERARLIESGFLTRQEGEELDVNKIQTFFKSETARRIFSAQEVWREQKFTIQIPARELYPELPEYAQDEYVVVQGIVDCAFLEDGGLVILDYKTDRGIDRQGLLQRYSGQLALYRRALTECMELPVKETLIYSFENAYTVTVP